METYTGFAQVYDKFMDNIDYDMWCGYLCELLEEYGVNPYKGNKFNNNIILDLGCGTGNITQRLSDNGYDMIGVDNSQDMLNIAREKSNQNQSILYLNQDMREFELYGTVAAVVSLCDSMNYITDYEDLITVLKLVNNYLDPGGVFIFDLKTISNYSKIGEAVIAEDREECSFIWDNYFDKEDNINEYTLSIFLRDENGKYDKYIETHYQKAYTINEIRKAIEASGMEFVAAYNAFTRETADEENDRIYVIAREVLKKTD